MDKLTVNGQTYVSVASVGDYGGDGSVGEANLRTLKAQYSYVQQPYSAFRADGTPALVYSHGTWVESPASEYDEIDLIVLYGDHGSETAFLRECDETADTFAALADYPILDDDEHSIVEMEWRDAAVPDAVRDVGRAMRAHGELFEEVWDALDQSQAEQAIYHALSNGTGCEVSYEYSGAYIDADAVAKLIAASWGDLVERRAVKLPDGTLIDLGEVEADEPTVFDDLPVDSTAAYVAEFNKRNHFKGE